MSLLLLLYSPAPANTFAIVNDANMTVTHLGAGIYQIVKTGGAAAYDAGANSPVGVAGDFVLRLERVTISSGGGWYGGGLDNNPTASTDSLGQTDFLWGYETTGPNWYIWENGTNPGFFANTQYAWIWRTGTALGYGRGATLAAAQASPDRTTTSSATLYFDAFSNLPGSTLNAKLYLPQDMVATSTVSFAASGAETASATLAGTSLLSYATTAQLRGSVTAVGSSTLTFTPSGAETAKGTLAGAPTITFTPSGAESAGGALSGSSALVFAPSGAETANGALAGSPSIAFGQSGTANLFTPVVAASSASFTTAGTVSASGSLVSSPSLSFGSSGTLINSAGAPTNIIGGIAVSFSAAGNVIGLARLTSSATLSLTSAAILAGIPAWAETAPPGALTITPTANPPSPAWVTSPAPAATPLAVIASPSAGTFVQDNDPAELEWSA